MLILIHVAQVHSIYLKDSKEKKGLNIKFTIRWNGSNIRGQAISILYENILDVSFLNMLSLFIY